MAFESVTVKIMLRKRYDYIYIQTTDLFYHYDHKLHFFDTGTTQGSCLCFLFKVQLQVVLWPEASIESKVFDLSLHLLLTQRAPRMSGISVVHSVRLVLLASQPAVGRWRESSWGSCSSPPRSEWTTAPSDRSKTQDSINAYMMTIETKGIIQTLMITTAELKCTAAANTLGV